MATLLSANTTQLKSDYTFHSQSHDQNLHSQTTVTVLILLDRSVAFDTVDHVLPLHCPKQLAIRETTLAPRRQRKEFQTAFQVLINEDPQDSDTLGTDLVFIPIELNGASFRSRTFGPELSAHELCTSMCPSDAFHPNYVFVETQLNCKPQSVPLTPG